MEQDSTPAATPRRGPTATASSTAASARRGCVGPPGGSGARSTARRWMRAPRRCRRDARLHGVHAHGDRTRPLRARRPGRRVAGARARPARVLDHGGHVHAPHEPRARRHDGWTWRTASGTPEDFATLLDGPASLRRRCDGAAARRASRSPPWPTERGNPLPFRPCLTCCQRSCPSPLPSSPGQRCATTASPARTPIAPASAQGDRPWAFRTGKGVFSTPVVGTRRDHLRRLGRPCSTPSTRGRQVALQDRRDHRLGRRPRPRRHRHLRLRRRALYRAADAARRARGRSGAIAPRASRRRASSSTGGRAT